jgi:hypothetical protein
VNDVTVNTERVPSLEHQHVRLETRRGRLDVLAPEEPREVGERVSFLYAVSLTHCMPVPIGQGGKELGICGAGRRLRKC